MMEQLSTPEAVTVLSLLMAGADGETKLEELASMLSNPFFREHVAEKIGPPMEFIHKYNQAKSEIGVEGMEKKAVASLKSAFAAFRIKTIALMTIIAQADNDFDQKEKELIARTSKALSVNMEEVGPEIEKMNDAPPAQPSTNKKEPSENTDPKGNDKTPPEKDSPEEKSEK